MIRVGAAGPGKGNPPPLSLNTDFKRLLEELLERCEPCSVEEPREPLRKRTLLFCLDEPALSLALIWERGEEPSERGDAPASSRSLIDAALFLLACAAFMFRSRKKHWFPGHSFALLQVYMRHLHLQSQFRDIYPIL